jgi:VanZ family protein
MLAASLLAYWTALFIGTHIPLPQLAALPGNSDKWMHFVAYAGLTYLLGLWMWASGRTRFRHVAVLIAGVACYGIFDELLQIAVNRHADVYDVMCDWLGVAIGVTALYLTRCVVERLAERPRRVEKA